MHALTAEHYVLQVKLQETEHSVIAKRLLNDPHRQIEKLLEGCVESERNQGGRRRAARRLVPFGHFENGWAGNLKLLRNVTRRPADRSPRR